MKDLIRPARSSSTNTTRDPESARPYSSSSPVHHAFSGTTTAPRRGSRPECHRPLGEVAHRDRHPVPDANTEATAQDVSEASRGRGVLLEAHFLVLVDGERPLPVATAGPQHVPSVAGALFQTRVLTPRMSTSAISNLDPAR